MVCPPPKPPWREWRDFPRGKGCGPFASNRAGWWLYCGVWVTAKEKPAGAGLR